MRPPRLPGVLIVAGLVASSSLLGPVALADSTGIADLVVTQTDAPDPVMPGQDVTYSISVANVPGEGTGDASSVSLTIALPTNGSFVSASTPDGTCGAPDMDGTLQCDLGTMVEGAVEGASVVVTALAEGTMTNVASASAAETDPTPADASSSESTTVHVPTADLRVSQTDAPDPVVVGGQVTYDVRVANEGPDSATGVMLTDTLPAGSTFVGATGDGTCELPASGHISCTLGSMAPDAVAQVSVTVVASTVGSMSNTASAVAEQDDPDATDDQSSESTLVEPVPPATPPTSDFDGDGFADLALGIPRRNLPGVQDAGAATVVYGSPTGLDTSRGQMWDEAIPGVAGAPSAGDLEGFALATGDLNGDEYADLAMGAPFEDVGGMVNAGSVLVLFGSASGLVASGSMEITQETAGMPGDPANGAQFGYALATGDFNGDGVLDLAVGAQRETVAAVPRAGAVTVIPGSTGGLMTSSASSIAPGSGKLAPPEDGSRFGSALEAADLDADGRADLAIGVPGADVAGVSNAGAVDAVRGSSSGLSSSRARRWTQDARGVPDAAEKGDGFGSELASGDLDADGRPDLVVGVSEEDLGGASNAGVAHVLPGSAKGVRGSGSTVWSQDSRGVPGSAGGADGWGLALAVGDLNGDGVADLAAGARYDDEAGDSAGTVNVLFGSPEGLSSANAQLWSQASPGVADDPEPNDHFGSVLAIGRFGPDPAASLAIGVHFENVGRLTHAGALHVLPGSPAGPVSAGEAFFLEGDLAAGQSTAAFDYFPFALSAH